MISGKPFFVVALGVIFLAAPLRVMAQSEAERLEKLERAVEQLQKRNAELESEVRNLKGKAAPVSAARETAPAKSVNEGKAVAEKQEEKKPVYVVAGAEEFKLTLGGYFQSQFEGGDPFAFEGRFASTELKDRFRVRRARITITGDYTEHFDFKVEGDLSFGDTGITVRDASGRTVSNSTRTSFSATDVFVNWHTYPEFNIKVGQYKAPFGLEQLTPDPVVISIERSLVTDSITPERQVGVQVWGKPLTNLLPQAKDVITYYAGIFNGTGRNITVNDNNEFLYAGRLEVQAVKTKILNNDATLKFGVDGVYSRDDAGTAMTTSVIRENSDGSLAGYNLPSAGMREEYGFDAALHIGPFDLVAEYLDDRISPRRVNNITPLFATFEPNGYYVQGSYFLIPKTLQLVAKWESFDPDQFSNDELRSITGGVNYYIHGNNVRLAANYIHTWSDFRDSRSLPKSDFDEVIVRLQLVF